MKVLVTGASGFFGSHIAEQLANDGHDVRVLVRKSSDRTFLQNFPHEAAIGDICDADSLPDAVEGVDGVVHAAGLVKARNEAEFAAVNGVGTANLLAAIAKSAPGLKRFIYVSSLTAHGPGSNRLPRPIGAPSAPVSAYGRTKLLGEIATQQSPLADRSVILRMPVIYGPRDPAMVPFFQSARFRLAPLLTGGHNRLSVVYVEDAVTAVMGTLTAEADVIGNIYTPEDGEAHTWRDILAAIEEFVGSRALRIYVPKIGFDSAALATEVFGKIARRPVIFTRDKVREMAQSTWVCSSHTLKRDLGWEAHVDITEGARRTGQWYRDHNWI